MNRKSADQKLQREINKLKENGGVSPEIIEELEDLAASVTALEEEVSDIPEVVANPVLEGTEGDLTGLQVGNTKYKVPSGGGGGSQLYLNHITINDGTHIITASLFSETDISNYNFEQFIDYMQTRGYLTSNNHFISCLMQMQSYNLPYTSFYLMVNSDTTDKRLNIYGYYIDNNTTHFGNSVTIRQSNVVSFAINKYLT